MSKARKRRALVTGATGFLGGHLVRHLEAAGWDVAMLARRFPATGNFGPGLERVKPYPYTGQTAEVLRAVEEWKPDAVFHVASMVLTMHTPEQVAPLIGANVLFGTQLLEAMRVHGCSVMVNAATTWQNYVDAAPWDRLEYRPVNLYAATKQAFEDIMQLYVEYGLCAMTLRLYDSYGPGDKRRKLIHLLLDTLRSGEALGMSPGEQVVDLVHVDDLCRAFLFAADELLEHAMTGVHVYGVSGGQRRTLKEAVATFEQAAGRKLPVTFGVRPYRMREVMHPWDGPQLPGWAPQVTLLDGFRELVRSEGLQSAL